MRACTLGAIALTVPSCLAFAQGSSDGLLVSCWPQSIMPTKPQVLVKAGGPAVGDVGLRPAGWHDQRISRTVSSDASYFSGTQATRVAQVAQSLFDQLLLNEHSPTSPFPARGTRWSGTPSDKSARTGCFRTNTPSTPHERSSRIRITRSVAAS